MHANSLELFHRFGLPHLRAKTDVLEIGPDLGWCCRGLAEGMGARYHHADLHNGGRGIAGFVPMADEYTIDRPGESFDVVFSLSVIEHVRSVWVWMRELARVIRPGGLVICVNPVSWPYHAVPVDCWRLFPDAYKALFEVAGLEHAFSWHGNLLPIDPHWRAEHGPQLVTDTIAVGRKPCECPDVLGPSGLAGPSG